MLYATNNDGLFLVSSSQIEWSRANSFFVATTLSALAAYNIHVHVYDINSIHKFLD